MALKTLLVQPPLTLLKYEIPSLVPPLGLAYIAAVLEKEGFPVEILDATALGERHEKGERVHLGLTWKEIEAEIKKREPDLVGVSCSFSSQSQNAHKVAGIVKKADPDTKVAFGGAHASTLPQEVLKDKSVDLIVRGEGEMTFLELAKALEKGREISRLEGTAVRAGKKIRINKPRPYIQDLDSLPFPARHLLPMERYVNAMSHGPDLLRNPHTSMVTSRGCPGNCVFCSIHTIWGRGWRPRSAGNVLDEIEHLVEKYGIKEIHFEDDNLTLDRKRTQEICKGVIARGLDISWTTPNGVALWTLDKETLQLMKRSGCYKLCFGIESGDPETLRFIRKPVKLDRAQQAIDWAKQAGIWTHGFFVIGFPFETKGSIENTIAFAKKSGLDFASFFLATPYPGTELYSVMEKSGLIPKGVRYSSLRTMNSSAKTKYFTSAELNQMQKQAYSEFTKNRARALLTNPKETYLFLRKFNSWSQAKFFSRFVSRFFQIMQKN